MEINKAKIVEEFKYMDWSLKAINLPHVSEKTKGEGVKIVIIDSGVDVNHKDIKDKVAFQFNMIDKNNDVTDESIHGTLTAGLIVGEHTGVAPMAEIHIIKVLNKDGTGTMSDVMDGITYALNIKADILSISLGTYEIPLIIRQQIVRAYETGMIITSAVGNDGRVEALQPANMKEVIGVGGFDESLNRASFSNKGYDVLAPSTNILSTYTGDKYARISGTSFATPLVAGSIALIISYCKKHNIKLSKDEIVKLLGKKLDLQKTFEKIGELICEKNGHTFETYTVSTGYYGNDIEQAGYCHVCGYDTHGDYFE